MPWWANLYLLVLSLLSLAGIVEQFRAHQKVHGLATLLSLLIFCSFVVAYYMPDIQATLGIWVVPLLILVAVYDFWLANLDLEPKSKFFMQKLPEVDSRMDSMTALAILLPAYAAGIMVAYKQLINL